MKCWHKGFTLIEIMVVVSIATFVFSIILVTISETRTKSRDSVRINDTRQLTNALEIYNLHNNQYPESQPGIIWTEDCDELTRFVLEPLLVPNYISRIPLDPINDPQQLYCYIYSSPPMESGNPALNLAGSCGEGKDFGFCDFI